MNIHPATIHHLEAITQIETQCFPPSEAATKASFRERLHAWPKHFWLLEIDEKIVGCINGMVTNQRTITDELFENAQLHDKNGHWQAIFGVAVLPHYQRRGYAAKLMERVIADVKAQKRKGLILTCKAELLHYYQKFDFVNCGLSQSVHGGASWYDMSLEF